MGSSRENASVPQLPGIRASFSSSRNGTEEVDEDGDHPPNQPIPLPQLKSRRCEWVASQKANISVPTI